jgi:hypothetical protein
MSILKIKQNKDLELKFNIKNINDNDFYWKIFDKNKKIIISKKCKIIDNIASIKLSSKETKNLPKGKYLQEINIFCQRSQWFEKIIKSMNIEDKGFTLVDKVNIV